MTIFEAASFETPEAFVAVVDVSSVTLYSHRYDIAMDTGWPAADVVSVTTVGDAAVPITWEFLPSVSTGQDVGKEMGCVEPAGTVCEASGVQTATADSERVMGKYTVVVIVAGSMVQIICGRAVNENEKKKKKIKTKGRRNRRREGSHNSV